MGSNLLATIMKACVLSSRYLDTFDGLRPEDFLHETLAKFSSTLERDLYIVSKIKQKLMILAFDLASGGSSADLFSSIEKQHSS